MSEALQKCMGTGLAAQALVSIYGPAKLWASWEKVARENQRC